MVKRIIGTAFFILVIGIFCYFRLKPLFFQTVGYTYDQGRDFLKAAEIVRDRNLTFIGPTTGIQGVFHGTWYYYLLVIPYLLFKGAPIGFYYFNFFLQLLSFLFLLYFLNKFLGFLPTLIVSLLVASSPYFIFTSIFVGNNILVIPTLLLFLIANFYLLEIKIREQHRLLFSIGILLGLITEFELAFGLFLMPTYIFTILINGSLHKFFLNVRGVSRFLLGLAIPFIPRILFEIKNGFMQTRVLLDKFNSAVVEHPDTYTGALQDRIDMFFGFYNSLFASEFLLLFFTVVIFLLLIKILGRKIKKYFSFFVFLISLIGLLFFLSVFYKDGFFWGNYFEGIQYLVVLLLALIIFYGLDGNSAFTKLLVYSLLVCLTVFNLNSFKKEKGNKKDNTGSLRVASQIVDYIDSKKNIRDNFCVKVYTPPVIPYTYNYLFLYSSMTKKAPYPETNWVNKECWFILEPDENRERRTVWLEKNLPRKISISQKKVFNDIEVALFSQ